MAVLATSPGSGGSGATVRELHRAKMCLHSCGVEKSLGFSWSSGHDLLLLEMVNTPRIWIILLTRTHAKVSKPTQAVGHDEW